MKGSITFETPWCMLILLLMMSGCFPTVQDNTRDSRDEESVKNLFSITPRQGSSDSIQSIQLYPEGAPADPPVLRIGENRSLVLEFDYLGTESKQFQVSVTHYDRFWEESRLDPSVYMGGFFEDYFGGGTKSFVQDPAYRHYRYEIPNRQLNLKVSGNYLLNLSDFNSGDPLFTLPFFVSEDAGTIETTVNEIFTGEKRGRTRDQLFSEYRYPSFVEFPRFDLSYLFVQNQFWGRYIATDLVDTSRPGVVRFYTSRQQTFLSDYEFRMLDLRDLSSTGRQVLDVDFGSSPPKVMLRRDLQRLGPVARVSPGPRLGIPADRRNARYAEVEFQLETTEEIPSYEKIYLVGDFNEWTIEEENRMRYQSGDRLWKGRALIKEGEYAYKYVIARNGRIDDLALDQSFSFARQFYTTLVYFQDPERHYDRLLKVENITY
ncbi:MAG: DUF5103 domain-containing protein [Balneolaceae bacterium]|nr:DUF5103 domain-containing protein [Balneolaceae bacterium]